MKRIIEGEQRSQISLTDPDSGAMATSRLGPGVVGYNVQIAVDAKHHLIVAHEVTNSVTDRGQLAAMAKGAKEAAAHPKLIVLADRGYSEGYEILECKRAGITAMVPKPLTSNGRFTAVEVGKTLRKYWSSACGGCHLKAQCTPAPQRRISRWEYEDVPEVVQACLNGAPEASRLRQRTVAHVFGT